MIVLLAVIDFWLLAIVVGVGFAFGRYAYQEFLEFLYQDLALLDIAIKKFFRKHYTLITTYRARMREDKWRRERLPDLKILTRHGVLSGKGPVVKRLGMNDGSAAIAERLMHVKHIRTGEEILTGEEWLRGQK